MNELYRYRNYNENTIRELLECELWHSHIRHLNDPFEHPFEFDWSEIRLENLCTINSSVKLFSYENMLSIHNSEAQKSAFDGLNNWLIIQAEELQKSMSSTFICCFSRNRDEPLMWSHYSDGMQGLCFVYDELELAQLKIKLTPATYNDFVKKLTYRDLKATVNSQKDSAFYCFNSQSYYSSVTANCNFDSTQFSYQKHTRWEYESEVRSVLFAENEIENSKSGIIEKVSERALKGVIIGSKMNKTNRKVIWSLCKEKGIPVHVAEPDRTNYSVIIHEDVTDPVNF